MVPSGSVKIIALARSTIETRLEYLQMDIPQIIAFAFKTQKLCTYMDASITHILIRAIFCLGIMKLQPVCLLSEVSNVATILLAKAIQYCSSS